MIFILQIAPLPPKLSPADAYAILINQPTIEQMRYAFEAIRRLLSKTKDPPVNAVVDAGLVDALVSALSFEQEFVTFIIDISDCF